MYLDYDIDENKIRRSFDNGEPRLLLICVDAMDASSAVTFDIFLWNEYLEGKAVNNKDTRNIDKQDKEAENYTIDYPTGISIEEHVTASMSPNPRY